MQNKKIRKFVVYTMLLVMLASTLLLGLSTFM
ncbi:stressosome-associated protein Prli42 [Mesobacillus zeae]|nr:stressosome-associated protein Prli42 [Mesobacillus zeae]